MILAFSNRPNVNTECPKCGGYFRDAPFYELEKDELQWFCGLCGFILLTRCKDYDPTNLSPLKLLKTDDFSD